MTVFICWVGRSSLKTVGMTTMSWHSNSYHRSRPGISKLLSKNIIGMLWQGLITVKTVGFTIHLSGGCKLLKRSQQTPAVLEYFACKCYSCSKRKLDFSTNSLYLYLKKVNAAKRACFKLRSCTLFTFSKFGRGKAIFQSLYFSLDFSLDLPGTNILSILLG